MSHKIGNKGPSFIKYELPRQLEKAAGGPPLRNLEKQFSQKLQKLLARLFKDGFEPSKPRNPGSVKTMAIPEEGGRVGGGNPGSVKTMAIPEEGGRVGGGTPPPGIKTMAIPEEGGRVGGGTPPPGIKTMAIPEEGGR